MNDKNIRRRSFLKRTGAVGVVSGIGGLAGCTGGNGGGSGGSDSGSSGGSDSGSSGGSDSGSSGGSDGGSSGDGSSGSSGGKTSSQDLTTVTAAIPPLGPTMLALGYLRDETDILEKELADAGYKLDAQITWDDTTLFAAGKVDFVPTLSDVEGTRIATERKIPVTFHGLFATNYEGWYVRKGSKWDPENSGGVQQTLDMLANGEGTWANAGWNQGSVVPGQICCKDEFGYDYGPDKSDFKVQKSDWFTLPKLLADGKVDMITNAPPLGSDIYMAKEGTGDNPITDIYWYQPGMKKAGFAATTANLGNFGTTQKFNKEHRDFVKAYMTAWKQGAEWASNPDNFDKILNNKKYVDALGGNNKAEARTVLEFSQQPPKHCLSKPGNLAPVMVTDIEIDDAYVKTDKAALKRAEELGSLPKGWQDWIEFDPIKL